VALILREFLLSLRKYVSHHESMACTSVAESPEINSNVVAGQNKKPKLEVNVGLCSGGSVFGSEDRLLESLLPDQPFSTDKVR
jgi:hypothetical protein